MSRRPNIVWIVADHLAFGNRLSTSATFKVRSRLAKDGVSFDRAYTVLPVCSPARASMLTGLYPHGHGVTENDGRFRGKASIGRDRWLVHQPLQARGYRCAWFGKWHLDNHYSALDYGFEGFSLQTIWFSERNLRNS